MVVFDFDGVIVKNRKGAKLWRWLAEKIKIKTPKIFLAIHEIIEMAFNMKPASIEETIKTIKGLQCNCRIGLLTDRSLLSLRFFFADKENIGFNDFEFIQTRKSFLNRLINQKHYSEKIFFESEKIKPDFEVLNNLKKFAMKKKIDYQEILIIDDMPQMIKSAKISGFSTFYASY